MKEDIGRQIKKLSTKIKRSIDNKPSIKAVKECSGVNAFLLDYINKNNGVYQKDLETEFGITRSTASKIVSLMEKKGYIERSNNEVDKRVKKLMVTEKTVELTTKMHEEIGEVEKTLTKGFTAEEINQLKSFLDRLENNLNM